MTKLGLETLALVFGGNDTATQAAKGLQAHAQTCAGLVDTLHQHGQTVPPGFAAACGMLHPDIKEGGLIRRNTYGKLTTQ